MHYAKGGDIHKFLATLGYKHEELAAAGVIIIDKEYKHIILQGIPSKLATFASHLFFLALIIHNVSAININALINQINEEANQLKI
jgi:hypothetical protein